VLLDLLSPFLPRDGIEMVFQLYREGSLLVIEGASTRRDRRGSPVVSTRAELGRGIGPSRVEVTVRGQRRTAELCAAADEQMGFERDDEGGIA
jgi:hypothetical protein